MKTSGNILGPLLHIFYGSLTRGVFLGGVSGRSRIDPGVNTCMLNNRAFLAIIECRTLSLRVISRILFPCFAITSLESARMHVQVLLFNFKRCTEAGIVYAEVVFASRAYTFFFIEDFMPR